MVRWQPESHLLLAISQEAINSAVTAAINGVETINSEDKVETTGIKEDKEDREDRVDKEDRVVGTKEVKAVKEAGVRVVRGVTQETSILCGVQQSSWVSRPKSD
jgi:hypothetical protein